MEYLKGTNSIYEDFGYWPSFHDDYIETIRLNSNSIEVIINCETKPKNFKSYKVKLVFSEDVHFELDGDLYNVCSIILDLQFTKEGDLIHTEINSSLGTSGTIKSRLVEVIKL